MLSVLLAVPRTPLYERLEKAGRLANAADVTRYVGTSGGTNFRPLNLTAEELRVGQEELYRRLYSPEAFAARLLGNLERFNNVKYRPEGVQLKKLATFVRLVRHYWGLGKKARRFSAHSRHGDSPHAAQFAAGGTIPRHVQALYRSAWPGRYLGSLAQSRHGTRR